MTIQDLPQAEPVQVDRDAGRSYIDVAKDKLQDKVTSLITKMQDTYGQVFEDRIPNQAYYDELKKRITGVVDTFSVKLLLDDSRNQVKFELNEYLKELNDISLKEWPLAYQVAVDRVEHIRKRGLFANIEFRGYFGELEKLQFQIFESQAQQALDEAKEQLITLSDPQERNACVQTALDKIKAVYENVELHIAKFSIPDTKDKILNRVYDILSEFEDLDLAKEEEQANKICRETDLLLVGDDKKTLMDVIAKQLDRLQEVDTVIEKKYFIRLIQHKYQEFLEVVAKLQADGLSLSDEIRYAKDRAEGSAKRIEEIPTVGSPTSLDINSQREITKKGTLKTFAHILKEAYTKYGTYTVESAIGLLPFSAGLGELDGIGFEEKRALAGHREKLIQEARTNLIWGDDSKDAKVPPILSEEEIKKIIDRHLEQASKSIYLAYAEQRIRKSLKFWMLRKTFEGHTEEQTQIMMKKTEKLIEEAKKELEAYLNEQTPPRVSIDETDARLSGEFTVDEKVVEGIISRYVIELSDICKVSL